MFRPVTEDERALHLRAAAQIREAVVGGRLKPGDRLPTERDLAAVLRVSRTVVRDALKLLSGEGLIDVIHGRGIFVTMPDEARVRRRMAGLLTIHSGTLNQLFEVRRALEGEAARWAAARCDKRDLRAMRAIVATYRRALEAGHLTAQAAMELDLRLHRQIMRATGNDVLVEVMDKLESLLIGSRHRTMTMPGRIEAFVDEMQQLVDAIASRNEEAAHHLLIGHLDAGWQALLDSRALPAREAGAEG